MRTLFIAACSVLISHNSYSESVQVTVSNESGVPVHGATVGIWFVGFTAKEDVEAREVTGEKGMVTASGIAKHSIAIIVGKTGWYRYRKENLKPNKNHNIKAVLRDIRDPVPLYVRDVRLVVPVNNQEIGFDFEIGDWVPPHGKGRNSDLIINFNKAFKGKAISGIRWRKIVRANPDSTEAELERFYGKWDAKVTLKIPDGGLLLETKNYIEYSKLRMPHKAPNDGYEESISLENSTYRQSNDPIIGGYFLQTRVVRLNGDVQSAYYAKIDGPITIDARGKISFVYYFNPVKNNRNLEFDPKANLATKETRTYRP